MPSDDRATAEEDDLRLYVAAFREVARPSTMARDANWKAIARQTTPPRRWWLWVGAAATLAAATWVLARAGGYELRLGRVEDRDARDQAGYVQGDETGGDAVARVGVRPVERPVAPTVEPAPIEPAPIEPAPIEPAPIEPAVDVPTPVPSAPPSTARAKPRVTPSLADETALFGEIQRALVDNQPGRALEAIRQHEREFPRGAFRNERVVAKARALCASGRVDAARKLRDSFLAKHGTSHLAPSMRSICSE